MSVEIFFFISVRSNCSSRILNWNVVWNRLTNIIIYHFCKIQYIHHQCLARRVRITRGANYVNTIRRLLIIHTCVLCAMYVFVCVFAHTRMWFILANIVFIMSKIVNKFHIKRRVTTTNTRHGGFLRDCQI